MGFASKKSEIPTTNSQDRRAALKGSSVASAALLPAGRFHSRPGGADCPLRVLRFLGRGHALVYFFKKLDTIFFLFQPAH